MINQMVIDEYEDRLKALRNEIDKLTAAKPPFKIMSDGKPCNVSSVPMEYALQYDNQAQKNHYQTIERLNERGGLSPVEFYAVAHGISWRDAEKIGRAECVSWLEREFSFIALLQKDIYDLRGQLQSCVFVYEEKIERLQKQLLDAQTLPELEK